jgi:hypothetical protein
MPGLPEASSEIEADPLQIGDGAEEEESARKKQRVVVSVDEIEESIMDEGFSADIVMAEVIDPTSASATTAPSTIPTLPASISTSSSIPSSSPRYRQPSPGAPTTSSSIALMEKDQAHHEIGSPVISIEKRRCRFHFFFSDSEFEFRRQQQQQRLGGDLITLLCTSIVTQSIERRREPYLGFI